MQQNNKRQQNPYYNLAYKNLHRAHAEDWGNQVDN